MMDMMEMDMIKIDTIEQLAVNAIRILSADAVQKAKSGHPGLPLGAAPIAYELYARHLRHNPKNPDWFDRDRFVLSAGHGSAMMYSLLHLFAYPKMSLDALKSFRQLGSLTPGHPEYRHTAGIEATTGPLGAGLGMAVGMAMAEAHLASIFNRDGFPLVDHYTYALCGDGCLMEGISSEVLSLAGTLKLGKLVVLYDSNSITIEGSTELAFTEDVEKRFEAYGFQVLTAPEGNDDVKGIGRAIEQARAEKSKPSLIKIETRIGYGVPAKEGKASAHGEPLGEENVAALRKSLQWPIAEAFVVPEEVRSHYGDLAKKGERAEAAWNDLYARYKKEHPDLARRLSAAVEARLPEDLFDAAYWNVGAKADATRNISGRVLNEVKAKLPVLMGGSADLAPSNKTFLSGAGDFSAADYGGGNVHFGVRELGMTAIGNGLLLHGGVKTYVATFFVFADYMKPMLRLSALMGLPLISVLTHDSIGVGEDGPTHQPVEQLAMLRATPNLWVFRPADEIETRAAWHCALTSRNVPVVIVLSRQNLPALEHSSKDALKGGYILERESGGKADAILIATGSEVALAVAAKAELEKNGRGVRVVSMPCVELFESQTDAYKAEVLPPDVEKRVVIEAGSRLSWGGYAGLGGAYVCMDSFGASAPADKLFDKYGFTVENVVNTVDRLTR
ncbi:MAG: transketolase [Synergistaceae bacterium]|jgi:transketolase|nr:transketolase [Synergistaceae bacterium]